MQRTELNKEVTWLKIHGAHNPNVPERHAPGFLSYVPEIGRPMSILSRENGDNIGIVTSTVTGVEQLTNGLLVRTRNSIYYIEFAL